MKTRFCPSPTGLVHLGNARTALFSVLLAKSQQGTFLLRIEDTDLERSQAKYAEAAMEDLQWLACNWQEGPNKDQGNGPYFQSERMAVYEYYYQALLEKNLAYPCFATEEELDMMRKLQRSAGQPPRYDGRYANLSLEEAKERVAAGEPYTIRLRVPDDMVIEFNDLIKGPQRFLGKDIGDFIIRRQNKMPTFMFCNAIDDSLMGVTHALRGEDHITNTPRQLLILRRLGLREPSYGHFSLIIKSDGGKLSKRAGDDSIQALRKAGYLSLALTNYMARLSHQYDSNELLNFEQLASQFDLNKFSRAPAKFDKAQLDFWQKQAVLALSNDELTQWLACCQDKVAEEKWLPFVALMQENIVFPVEAVEWANILFSTTPLANISEQAKEVLLQSHSDYFTTVLRAFEEHGKDVKAWLAELKLLGLKGKALFQPLRVALTGQLHGPELSQILALMPDDVVTIRFDEADKVRGTHASNL